jgi:hypothetical protein
MKSRVTRLAAAVGLCVVLAACGGNSTAPSNSTPFAGSWNGTYAVNSCVATNDFLTGGFCNTLTGNLIVQMFLSQSGSTVSGTFTLGTLGFQSSSGAVGSDGSLTLKGTTILNGTSVAVTLVLQVAGSSMTGSIAQLWTSVVASGQLTLTGTLNQTTKQ